MRSPGNQTAVDQFRYYHRKVFVLLLIAALLLAAGCAPTTQAPVPPPQHKDIDKPIRKAPPPVTGKAMALFRQAQNAKRMGKPGEAELLLERALRIEPRNPRYWYAMADIKYSQGKYPQAVQFCLKAESLAPSRSQIADRSRLLLGKAQEKMGVRSSGLK